MPLLDRRGLYANLYKQQSPRRLCDQDVITGLPLPSTSETEMKPHAQASRPLGPLVTQLSTASSRSGVPDTRRQFT
mgnify:CR=1 FL=1